MGQEPDVARVAAAMNTPGLKYRSFGNLPVRAEPAREDTPLPGPEEVLRELRSAAAAAREAPAERPAVELPTALAPIMAVPPIEDTLNPYAPPPAPRFRPPPPPAPRSAAPSAPPPLPPVMTLSPRPPAPRLVPAAAAVAEDALETPTVRLPRPAPVAAPAPAPPPPPFVATPVPPPPPITATPAPSLPAAPPPPPPPPPVMATPVPAMPAAAPPPPPPSPVMATPVPAMPAAAPPPPPPAPVMAAPVPPAPPVLVAPAPTMPPPPPVMAAPAPVMPAPPVMVAAAPPIPATPPRPSPPPAPPVKAAPALLPQAVVAPPPAEARPAPPPPVTPAPAILPQLVVSPPPAPAAERSAEVILEPVRLFEVAAAPPPAEPPAAAPALEPALALFAQMLEMPQESPPPKVAQVDWAALSAPAPAPQPPLAETGLFARPREATVQQPLAPTPMPTPMPAMAPADDFAIFAGLASRREAPPPAPPAPAGSTMSRLKQVVTHPGQAGLPQPLAIGGLPDHQRGLGAASGGSMPAAAVTVPLGEVMRLVAAGGPPAATPFDTFRAALRTPSPF